METSQGKTAQASAAALPLLATTPPRWAAQALAAPLELLDDHAHLERKAASNALALLHRWPDHAAQTALPMYWVSTLTDIARDEVAHLGLVLKLLQKRGAALSKWHENRYANDLREAERRGSDPDDLVDRLLVSALIEARSCERFLLLAETAEEPELTKLYRGLWSSEHGHYLVFLQLAREAFPDEQVDARWEEMLAVEAQVIRQQPAGAKMHSWPED